MKIFRLFILTILSLIIFPISGILKAAPVYELVHGFSTTPKRPSSPLILGPDGYLWGSTSFGGLFNFGTIYKVKTDGSQWSTIVSFNGAGNDGLYPLGNLINDGSGFVWGVADESIFKINAASGVKNTVVNFKDATLTSDFGTYPQAGLVKHNGFIWGTTSRDGVNGAGTIFKVNIATGDIEIVAPLTDGASEAELVSDGAGFLWGTTNGGGTNEKGTVFKVNTATGILTTVINFTGNGASNKGYYPVAALIDDGGGFLWGTTAFGGATDNGTIFKVNISSGSLTTVLSFTGTGASNSGSYANSALVKEGGFLWGTTQSGGVNDTGTIFKINISSGALITVLSNASGDYSDRFGFYNDGAGFLYGTEYDSGITTHGRVFKINAATDVRSTLVQFTSPAVSSKGRYPGTALTSDSNGLLWGTTFDGGASNRGTAYRLDPASNNFTSYHFTDATGGDLDYFEGNYLSSLVSDGAGFLWGTNTRNLTTYGGLIYKINEATGAIAAVLSFADADEATKGSYPSALTNDGTGFLWGANYTGGASNNGTLFKINIATGSFALVLSFTGNGAVNKGNGPSEGMILVGGSLWGTTILGGANDRGTIFRVDISTGALVTVHSFADESFGSRLVSDSNGGIWGVSAYGGVNDRGFVFKVNAATGVFTKVVDFPASTIAGPSGSLMYDGNGSFWGVTTFPEWTFHDGGVSSGSIFKLNATTNALSTELVFTANTTQPNKGFYPHGLAKHTDGNIYGTTRDDGPNGGGTIYRLRFGPTPATLSATPIGQTTATLHGTLNPNGLATTAAFEWGTSPTLATSTLVSAGTVAAGSTAQAVSAALTGLTAGTTYYYRVRGVNSDNTVPQRGEILSFTTGGGVGVVVSALSVSVNEATGYYDVRYTLAGASANVALFSSVDNGTTWVQAQTVTGQVGAGQTVGANKLISWRYTPDGLLENDGLGATVRFRVVAGAASAEVSFRSPDYHPGMVPTVVRLCFGVKAPAKFFIQKSGIKKGQVDAVAEPSSAAAVPSGDQATILSQTRSIYTQAGISQRALQFESGSAPITANATRNVINVFFTPAIGPDAKGGEFQGYALTGGAVVNLAKGFLPTIPRFNTEKQSDVVIFYKGGSSTSAGNYFKDPLRLAETVTHELGHCFGLVHLANFTGGAACVMDYVSLPQGSSSVEGFYGTAAPLKAEAERQFRDTGYLLPAIVQQNERFHLLRYVEGIPTPKLKNGSWVGGQAGIAILPGNYDRTDFHPQSVLGPPIRSSVFSLSNLAKSLNNVEVYIEGPEGRLIPVVSFDVRSPAQMASLGVSLPEGARVRIFASSVEGGESDIVIGGADVLDPDAEGFVPSQGLALMAAQFNPATGAGTIIGTGAVAVGGVATAPVTFFANGRAFQGSVLNGRWHVALGVQMTAEQAAVVTTVEYYSNGSKIGQTTGGPSDMFFSAGNGPRTLRFVGKDAAGATVFDQTEEVTIGHVGTDDGAVNGKFTGILKGTPDLPANAGTFTMTTTARNTYSVKMRLGGATLKGKGTWDSAGKATLTIPRRSQSSLTLRMTRSNDPATNEVLVLLTDGTISSANLLVTGGTFISECVADGAVWHPRLNPADADEGKYTFYIEPGTGQGAPLGYGCGTLSVSRAGNGKFAGLLADGTKFSVSAVLSKDSALSFYVTPYRKTGRFSGRIVLRDTPGVSDGDGAVTWSRLATESVSSFTTNGRMLVSRYTEPGRGVSMLTLGQSGESIRVDVTAAGVADSYGLCRLETNSQRLLDMGESYWFEQYGYDPAVGLKLSPKDGKWSGRFAVIDSGTGYWTDYWAIAFQKTRSAHGFYLYGEGGAVSFGRNVLVASIADMVSAATSGLAGSVVNITYTVVANRDDNVLFGTSLVAANGTTYGVGTGFAGPIYSGTRSIYTFNRTVPSIVPGGDYTLRGAMWRDNNSNGIIDGADTLIGSAKNFGAFRVVAATIFVQIPGGTYQMGDNSDGVSNAPVHSITLSTFYLQNKETTIDDWNTVKTWALANNFTFTNAGAGKATGHPVHTVSWYDVVKWCNARSLKENLTPCYYTDAAQTLVYKAGEVDITNTMVKWSANGYRLPTEAEWEIAARGGLSGKRFPWGDTASQSLANYKGDTSFSYDTGPNGFHPTYNDNVIPYTSSVGSFAVNGGLYDMAGNVFEWCWDRFGTYAAGTDPHGPETGLSRMWRGGSWISEADYLRCAARGNYSAAEKLPYLGFRPARSVLP